jgi:hypothetical protein
MRERMLNPNEALRDVLYDYFTGKLPGSQQSSGWLTPVEEARLILVAAQSSVSASDMAPASAIRILEDAVEGALDQLRKVRQ